MNSLTSAGDTVAFDGELTPSTAEVRGGSGGHEPLNGEERQVVEQVIRFENAAPVIHQAVIEARHHPLVEERLPATAVPVFRRALEVIRATAPPQDPRRQPRPRDAPVAPRRATANGMNIPRRPAGPGFAAPRRRPRPVPNLREAIMIESDSSDSSSDESGVSSRRGAQRQAPTRRRDPGTRPVVIDLTQEVPIIDLTGDD